MSSNSLNVLFMPAIDGDLSNYMHYVAPDRQHSGQNWNARTGDEVRQGQTIYALEYEDLASVRDSFLGLFFQMLGVIPRPSKGTFSLKCPVDGTLHIDSGFYGDAPAIHDFDKLNLENSSASLRGARYSFHIFTEARPNIFPYAYYKPWFEFVSQNRHWIENSIRHWSGDNGVQKWQRMAERQKGRFQTVPCKVISYNRFIELERERWEGQPNKPEWL
ncbi:hypothetical protein IWQ54_001157 [Labrenzia sp. EL_195]|nr:hypothetical protein [Labrenzia sp. EL_195]